MSGYAPNPSSSSDTGYASLTAGLLARKGEAMPAVDADAHAGVDIDMRPVVSAGAPSKDVSQQTIESLYPSNPTSEARTGENARPGRSDHGAVMVEEAPRPVLPASSPDIWAIAAPRSPRPARRRSALRSIDQGDHQRKATVTFRIPAKEFVRMRFAARDLEMSCQALILEALDCYLDANDIAPVADELCDAEVDRLMRKGQKKPPARKAASLAE